MKKCKFLALCVMMVAVLFTTCLNPIAFDPEQAIATIRVTGELGIYDTNNAILWIINCTKNVNIEDLAISVEPYAGYTVPEGYPMSYGMMPGQGTSIATYHRPASSLSQMIPYWYKIRVGFHDQLNYPYDPSPDPSVEHFLEHVKQLPKPGENYKIYLVRLKEGHLALVEDELPPAELLDTDDFVVAPEPASETTPLYPIIVRNRTQSAKITGVTFNGTTHGNPVMMGDQYGYYLPANKYVTNVSYTVIGDVSSTTGNYNAEIIKDTNMTSQSYHLLFLDFYRNTNGQYRITQDWTKDSPNGPSDLDVESLYHGDFEYANVRLTNAAAGYMIYAVSAQQESYPFTQHIGPEYVVAYENFLPIAGPISHTGAKIVGFRQHPNELMEFSMPYNKPFTINVYLQSTNEGVQATPENFIVVPYYGWGIFPGRTVEITVYTEDIRAANTSQEKFTSDFAKWREEYHGWNSRVNRRDGKPNGVTDSVDIIFEEDPGGDTNDDPNDYFEIEIPDGSTGRAKIDHVHRGDYRGHGSFNNAGEWVPGEYNPNTGANRHVKYTIHLKDVHTSGVIRIVNKRQRAGPTGGEHERRHVYITGEKTPSDDPGATPENDPDDTGNITDEGGNDVTFVVTDEEDTTPPPPAVCIPVTSVRIVGDNTIKPDGQWYSFAVEILPTTATDKTLRWSKGILVDPTTVDFKWNLPAGSNIGTLQVMMTSQFREKKDQLPKQANKLDMMVWADNACTGGQSQAPQNFSVEEGILFVGGRDSASMREAGFPNGYPVYPVGISGEPLYTYPPTLDQWIDNFKGILDRPQSYRTPGIPFRQPKVTIKIDNK